MENISQSELKSAADMIQGIYGDLRDMPRELANTVCNIYYLSFLLLSPHSRKDLLRPYIGASKSGYLDMRQLLVLQNRSTVDLYGIKDQILALRKMRATAVNMTAKAVYGYCVAEMLDIYKYGIENADRKNPLRRALERKFKTPHEIPNLIDLMNAAGYRL